MFISITEELSKLIIGAEKDSKEEAFIISLLDMYKHGKHIVKLNFKLTSHLKERFKDINQHYYGHVCNIERLYDLASINENLTVSICFSDKGGINRKNNIIHINYLMLNNPSKWSSGCIYLENEADWINVYSHILDWYIRTNFPDKKISNNLYPYQMGGCSEIIKKFSRLDKTKEEGIHIAIMDSDKHFPSDKGNNNGFENINKHIQNRAFVGDALMLETSEVENLIPIDIYKAKNHSKTEILNSIESVEKLLRGDINAHKFHDFKEGLKTIDLCNKKGDYTDYWSKTITSTDLKDNLSALKRGCRKKNNKPCSTCYIVKSLVAASCDNILCDIRNPKLREKNQHLEDEWNRIGLFLLSWGICTKQSTSEIQIS